jgi:hypothetical protein
MIDVLVPILGLLVLMSVFKGWHLDPMVYGEGPSYVPCFYGAPGYQDDGQAQQARRHERERERRAKESRCHW